jgi:hypothetical protein
MNTTEKWLNEQLEEYEENPVEALEHLLASTNDTIRQYVNNPNCESAKAVLISCMEHNNLFFERIGLCSQEKPGTSVISEHDINREKWTHSRVECDICSYSWIAVYLAHLNELQCPNCLQMARGDF